MGKKYYRIKVPDEGARTDEYHSSSISLIPKFNKKISFKVSMVTSDFIKFDMKKLTGGDDVAYPNGDSIIYQGVEYLLKTMVIFRGLYNDYTGITTTNDKAEVMLVFQKEGDTTHSIYIFFLLDSNSMIKSGFFDSFQTGSSVTPKEDAEFDDEKVSILDIMPNNSNKVHVFNDITRKMNQEYDTTGGKKLNATDDYGNSHVIIFSNSPGGFKNIPMDPSLGYFFGNDNKSLVTSIYGNVNTIELKKKGDITNDDKSLDCPPNILSQGKCVVGKQIQWKKGGVEEKDDGTHSNVYLLGSTQKYKRLDNPFTLAHAIGGVGSVLTSCYEVEIDASGAEVHGEKHIPAFKDKYTVPENAWFYPKKKLTEEEIKKQEEEFAKFWSYPEPGFYILMVLLFAVVGVVIVLGVLWFKNNQMKKLIIAAGKTAAGPP